MTGEVLLQNVFLQIFFRSSSSSCSSTSLPPIPQYLTLPSRGSAFHKPPGGDGGYTARGSAFYPSSGVPFNADKGKELESGFHKPFGVALSTGKGKELEQYANQRHGRQGSVATIVSKTTAPHQLQVVILNDM